LAGGTLDIWPLYLFHPGAVTVNVAVDLRAWCRVETGVAGVRIESKDTATRVEGKTVSEVLSSKSLPLVAYILRALQIEEGVEVTTLSSVPPGSGLGGSSSLAVVVAAAAARARGSELPPEELWPIVRDAEAQSIGVPTGIQDYHAALRGGVLALELEPGAVRVTPLGVDPDHVEACLMLVDAGATRFSGINNWEVFKGQIEGDAQVQESLAEIARVARSVRGALAESRCEEVAPLMAREWRARKRLAPSVTTPEIDRISEVALAAGGAAKVCGAGGGGMVAVWTTPEGRPRMEASLRHAGFPPATFRVDRGGLLVQKFS